jgi:hypothetical protein
MDYAEPKYKAKIQNPACHLKVTLANLGYCIKGVYGMV